MMPCCVQICFVLILILRCLVYCFHACVYKNAHFPQESVCFLKWSIVFGWFGVWSVACFLNGVFVGSFVFSCFVVVFSILLFFVFLTHCEVS